MPNYCHVAIAGHLARDPELRHTQAGMAVCKGAIAFNTKRGDEQKATFVDFVLFKEQAERFHDWMHKGDAVLLDGTLQQESWEDKDTGAPRSKLSMIVNRFENLTPRNKAEPERKAPARSAPATRAEQARADREQRDQTDYRDIPF